MNSFRRSFSNLFPPANGPEGNQASPSPGSSLSSPEPGRRQLHLRQLQTRQYWMPDAVSVDCYECGAKFNTFRRRHHCRVCGQIFCYKCCNVFISGKLVDCAGSLRVCQFCYNFFESNLMKDAAGSSDTPGGNSSASGGYSNEVLSNRRMSSVSEVFDASKAVSTAAAGISEENFSVPQDLSALSDDMANSPTAHFFLKDPRQLELLREQITSENGGLELGTKLYDRKMYYNCFSGEELVQWICRRENAVIEEGLAITICQALLDAGHLQSLSGLPFFENGSAPYRVVKPEEQHRSSISSPTPVTVDEATAGPEWLKDLEVSRSSNNTMRKKNKKKSREETSRKSISDEIDFPGVWEIMATEAASKQTISVGKKMEGFEPSYSEYASIVLEKLLSEEGMDFEKWLDKIRDMVNEVMSTVNLSPVVMGHDMNIGSFIKIKKIPGGDVSDCRIVRGEAFSGRVILKGMPLKLSKAKVLLVRGSISFHRKEDKHVSLLNLQQQEEEEFGPELILVENTVCGAAREALEKAGIALVLNVKISVLNRISRFLQVEISESIGSMITIPALGECTLYENILYSPPKNCDPKSLVIIECDQPQLGATILLRGGRTRELMKVKRIMRRLIILKHNIKVEKAFLSNESATPEALVNKMKSTDHGNEWDIRGMTLTPLVRVTPKNEDIMKTAKTKASFGSRMSGKSEDRSPLKEINRSKGVSDRKRRNRNYPNAPPGLINCKFTPGMEAEEFFDLIAEYRSGIGYFCPESSVRNDEEHDSDPNETVVTNACLDRKCFSVLFASYAPNSRASPYYCVMPWIVNLKFYSSSDISIGGFLNMFCFSDASGCPNERVCGVSTLQHVRRFCHGTGSVTMKVEEHVEETSSSLKTGDIIMTWKYCIACKKSTPMVPASKEMLSYSFAMFLLLLIYDDQTTNGLCPHPIHRGPHVTCFLHKNVMTTFSTANVSSMNIVLPSKKIVLSGLAVTIQDDQDTLQEENKYLYANGPAIFNTILEELVSLRTSFQPSNNPPATFEDKIAQAHKDHETDYAAYKELQRSVNASIDAEDNRCQELMFKTKHFLADCLQRWKRRLQSLYELKKKDRTRLASGTNLSSSGSEKDTSNNVNHVGDAKGAKSKTGDDRKNTGSSVPNFEAILGNPFPPNLHYNVSPTQKLVVDEFQPSSLIAHTLTTPEYDQFITNFKIKSEEMNSTSSPHFELQFSDESCKFYCCTYFAKEFHKLRLQLFDSSESGPCGDFITSISECKQWDASGGKSGMAFFKTRDDRFILKQMSKFEFQSFQSFAPNYFEYIHDSLQSGSRTALAKIIGVFRIGFKNTTTTHNTFKLDLLIIENLFYGKDIKESYDLKGSIRNRLAETTGKSASSLVLLDENLLKVSCSRPLYITEKGKMALLEAINNDTKFLARHSMMDYSLLVGIDSDRQILVIGIIDYIRTFTWDKKLETLVKSSGFLGGSGKTPTVISPNLYMKRFLESMYKYFILVPGFWFKDPNMGVEGEEMWENEAMSEVIPTNAKD